MRGALHMQHTCMLTHAAYNACSQVGVTAAYYRERPGDAELEAAVRNKKQVPMFALMSMVLLLDFCHYHSVIHAVLGVKDDSAVCAYAVSRYVQPAVAHQ